MRDRKIVSISLGVLTAGILAVAAWVVPFWPLQPDVPLTYEIPATMTSADANVAPTLRAVADAVGHRVITPVFPGREPGATHYRWYRSFIDADGQTFTSLAWSGASGGVWFAEFPIPLALDWPNAIPSPGPGPSPEPVPPVPTPTPTPEPEPLAPLWGSLIIEETGQRTPGQATVILSRELALYFQTSKLAFRIEDQDAEGPDGKTPEDLTPYIERAKKAGVPQVFIIATDGKIVHQGSLPATSSAFVALMRLYAKGGK